MIEQLEKLINGEYESTELMKTALTDAMPTFKTFIDNNKSQRKELGTKVDALIAKQKGLKDVFGFEDDEFSIDDIKSYLKDNSSADLDKLKASLESKYEKDMTTLRSELATKDGLINETTTKYNDSLFKSAIVESGLLSEFVDEPMARNNITAMIKDKLIYEDGKVYVKDSTTGEKAKDIRSGEFLSPKSVIDGLKTTISPIYLNPAMKNNGTNTPPSNQSVPTHSSDKQTPEQLMAAGRK
jgi:hypothetical protein